MTVFQRIRAKQLPARMTVADVYRLQEEGLLDDRDSFELVDGEIVPMAAAKASHHEQMKSRLLEALVLAKPSSVGLYVEPSVTFSDATLLEPDLALWPRSMIMEEVRGPDLLLVIEVASSSIAYDLRVKSALYASFGVRDYWVVDAVRQTIRTHRDPQDRKYLDVEEYEAEDVVAALLLPDVRISWPRCLRASDPQQSAQKLVAAVAPPSIRALDSLGVGSKRHLRRSHYTSPHDPAPAGAADERPPLQRIHRLAQGARDR